jgi:hypothetical protein
VEIFPSFSLPRFEHKARRWIKAPKEDEALSGLPGLSGLSGEWAL